jgi:hypothetical protein
VYRYEFRQANHNTRESKLRFDNPITAAKHVHL